MTKIYTTLLVITLSVYSFAQDSASVLFIGNSYTAYNNLPSMVNDLTVSLGDYLEYDSNTPGGANFNGHANNATNYAKINSRAWDYVVLQAQSQEPSFPESQVNTETLPYAMQLADSVYDNNFCSEVLFYMTWGRENGDPQWGPISTFEGMNDRLRNAYLRFADSVQGSCSPVGVAWRYVRENYPAVDLYTADGSHPSLEGSYLAACTFYASIFRKSPVGSTFTGGVDPVVAGQLQNAAAICVLDSLDTWNLRPVSEHTQAAFLANVTMGQAQVDFENQSTKALTYVWDFGDGSTSTDEHPNHTYASNGTYTVQLIAASPCDSDTVEYTVNVTIDDMSVAEHNLEGVVVKNLGSGIFELNSTEKIIALAIFDPSGRKVEHLEKKKIDLSAEPTGMYIIHVTTQNQFGIIRLAR